MRLELLPFEVEKYKRLMHRIQNTSAPLPSESRGRTVGSGGKGARCALLLIPILCEYIGDADSIWRRSAIYGGAGGNKVVDGVVAAVGIHYNVAKKNI